MWLLYLLLFGPRRSSCAIPSPAAPADEPATTVSSDRPEAAATCAHTGSQVDDVDDDTLTDAPTRQDIVDALRYMNDTAKVLRRQGYTGIYGQSYTRLHSAMDGLLYDLAAMELDESLT